MLNLDRSSRLEGSPVGEDEDLEDQESEADKAETEDLTALEGDFEAVKSINVAQVSGLVVADRGDLHANETTKHASAGTNDKGERGEGELGLQAIILAPRHVDGTED